MGDLGQLIVVKGFEKWLKVSNLVTLTAYLRPQWKTFEEVKLVAKNLSSFKSLFNRRKLLFVATLKCFPILSRAHLRSLLWWLSPMKVNYIWHQQFRGRPLGHNFWGFWKNKFVYAVHLCINFVLNLNGIWTPIVRVEGEHADQWTTTAKLYRIY